MTLWRYDEVMDLIGFYEEEPVLWDPNHPTFEHERKSNEAWERIKAGMGPAYKVEGLKLVMASLKQMYHKNKRENTIPKNSSNNNYFHKLDSFLGKTSTYVTTADSTQVEKIEDIEGVKVALDQELRDITKDLATTKDDVEELTQQVVNVKVKDAGVLQQEDVCGLYGKLLVEKLRHVPESKRLSLMHELDGIVYRHLDIK